MSNDPDGNAETPSNEDPLDDVNAVSIARVRSNVYGLLAATFDGDVETIATAIENGTVAEIAAALPGDAGADTLSDCDLDGEALAVGYDNLFLVPGPHYVPPFASAHEVDPSESFESDSPYHDAGEAGELLGDPAAEMAHAYTSAGFQPDRGDGIPDHLAAIFEFMRALSDREREILTDDGDEETLAAVRNAQREMLSRLGWLDTFHESVADEDSVEGIFAALARFARTFTAWDARERDGSPT